MYNYFIITFFLLFTLHLSAKGQNDSSEPYRLPQWITTNPAFQKPQKINSLQPGDGFIMANESKNVGWVIELNSELGLGIEIILEELIIGTENEDYLLIAGWPLSSTEFKRVHLFTGSFKKKRKLRILNTKEFFVLFNAGKSKIPPKLFLSYKRYGNAYHSSLPSTEKPVKKDTVYEVNLKGKKPDEYSNNEFLMEIKKAIRITAEAYCFKNQIPFNSNISTDEMVIFHRITFCPFEWPDRDICVSVEHSVFVSGEKMPGEQITMDYELTSNNLKNMWEREELLEIIKLGLMVYKLPKTADVITWWVIIVGVAIILSLTLILVFCKSKNYSKAVRKTSENSSIFKGVTAREKPAFKVARKQQIPAFMNKSNGSKSEELTLKPSTTENLFSSEIQIEKASPKTPIKNYFGSLLFSSNKAFEDDEEFEETPPN